MAIVEMKKLRLASMTYERDKILNALQKTGAVEVKLHAETENTVCCEADGEATRALLSATEAALSLLASATEAYNRKRDVKSDELKDGFEVSYSDFMAAREKAADMAELTRKINSLTDEKNKLSADLSRLERTLSQAQIYGGIEESFNAFADTAKTRVWLGTVPAANADGLEENLKKAELSAYEILARGQDGVLVCVAAHRSAADEVSAILSGAAFAACPFSGDKSGKEFYGGCLGERELLTQKLSENEEELYALSPQIKGLKIYCDYLAYELEKLELSQKMRATERTFLLEAYVPAPQTEQVKAAIDGVTDAAFYEFFDLDEDEMPPTLMENKPVVRNFEAITNMYSPPSPKEFDPNAVMGFFYSVFLGFIMGDVGYGLLMLFGGGAIYFKTKRDGGLKRLAGVFATGGIFAIVWGLLFNSFFGISIEAMYTVMPDAQSDMWEIMGIRVPAVLVISLVIGIVQLFAGYICKAVQYWRRGKFFDGLWEGITWALFSVGVALAIFGLVDMGGGTHIMLAEVGGILAACGLVLAMLTAGRKEKFFGKFTKGFGALYGIINYASDVLSYARLYGLMLSGAVIAQIISQYGGQFVTSGNFGLIILGLVIMVLGHAFNLAISLLGAYIHDARLQYVEFYGRFFEGEGELFTPLGSQHKYVYVADNN